MGQHIRRELAQYLDSASAEAYLTAVRRGQISEETTQLDLWEAITEEVDEFGTSKPAVVDPKTSIANCNPEQYEKIFKNTTGDELADLIIASMSTAYKMGIPVGQYVVAKLNYNNTRD